MEHLQSIRKQTRINQHSVYLSVDNGACVTQRVLKFTTESGFMYFVLKYFLFQDETKLHVACGFKTMIFSRQTERQIIIS